MTKDEFEESIGSVIDVDEQFVDIHPHSDGKIWIDGDFTALQLRAIAELFERYLQEERDCSQRDLFKDRK